MRTILSGGFILLCLLFSPGLKAQHGHSHEGRVHTKSYAVKDAGSAFEYYEFERRAVGDHDILVDILYCGICHSDIHTARGEWGSTSYPCVPGHEIVGRVARTGRLVSGFKVGDIAGIGCMVGSCGECEYCLKGQEQHCLKSAVWTYGSPDGDDYTKGGYSSNIVVNERFAVQVPPDAPLEKIAPLLCAGVTTWSPLRRNGVKPGDKVGIAGFGGLGHMALQYAGSFGAETTVFDISEDKRQAAMELGAAKFVNVNNPGETNGMRNTFDVIISTIPTSFDVETYTRMLKAGGTMVLLGVPANDQVPTLRASALNWGKSLQTSLIGGMAETREMLEYSIANNIYPRVEVIGIQQIDQAYQNILDGKARFRYVIDLSTLK